MADVAGKLVSIAADNKVADAKQIFDEDYNTGGEFQSAINKELKGDVSSLKGSVEDIKGALGLGAKPEQGGNSSSIQQRVDNLETKVCSLDYALDTHWSRIENIDNRVIAIENKKPVDSLTSDQKKMLENLDKTFNIEKNADGTYTVSMKSGADFSFKSATLNDFMSLVEIINAADGSEQTQIRLSGDAAGLWLSKDKYDTTSTKLWSNGDVEIIVGESNNDLVLKKGEDGTPMNVMSEITNLKKEIGTSDGSTTSLSARVGSLETSVASKADASVVNSIESAVDTHGSQIESLWSSIRSVLNFKGDANNNTITAINNETITGVKVGDCYRWSLDTSANIAPHNVTNSYAVVERDDVMVCVSVEASHISGGCQCTTWLIVQANLSSEQLKIQIDNALDGIKNAYEYWVTQQEEGADTSKDAFFNWMKKPSIDAATQANNALDQLNNKNWADVTKEEYNAMDANTSKNENGVWTPVNPNLPWLNKDVKYIVEAEVESSGDVISIINSMLVPITREDYDNLEVKNPSAFYFITV